MIEPLYRPHILAHARNPQFRGVVVDATHEADQANPQCGDRCRITARIVDTVMEAVHFDGEGCALSTAATSILLEDMQGKPLAALHALTDDAFLQLLGVDVTSGRIDCALFGLRTLRSALAVRDRPVPSNEVSTGSAINCQTFS